MKVKYIFGVLVLFCASIAIADDGMVSHGVVAVAAVNDEWTATNIRVAQGDILLTTENGNKIVVGNFLGSIGADGLPQSRDVNIEGVKLTVGALELKVGNGAAQRIGSKGFVVINETGKIKLRIYDTDYRDNSGEYQVHIIRIPAGLIPLPVDASAE